MLDEIGLYRNLGNGGLSGGTTMMLVAIPRSLVALAALMAAFPAFAQLTVGQAVLVGEPRIALPQGDELSDAELLDVDGEADPLTVAAIVVVGAGVGAGLDLFMQGVEIALGRRSHIDASDIGKAAGLEAVAGLISSPAVPIARSAFVTGASWTAQAAATVGSAAVSIAHRAHQALHTAHVALHTYVREPVVNAFRSA